MSIWIAAFTSAWGKTKGAMSSNSSTDTISRREASDTAAGDRSDVAGDAVADAVADTVGDTSGRIFAADPGRPGKTLFVDSFM
ncbi:hypothetical protein [Herbaspirillum sp. VT-16-41]|uniref:hypothetical protein n=1 Tax=Herbaspirillum sp. VT-16-41 TaxID=1953765 RepID=UPI001C2CA0BD|nr:hypothetical protein [Herbaspirillum sp. VT-16-41]